MYARGWMLRLTAVTASKSQLSVYFIFSFSDFVHLTLAGDGPFKKISASIPVLVQHFKNAKVSSRWIGSSQPGNN